MPLVPPQVRGLKDTVLNETAVMLVWSPPDNPNGILIEYQVIYDLFKETQKEQVSGELTIIQL